MFVILIQYTAPLETIDGLMKRHVAFLEPHLRSGTFLAAGRRKPRSGGVILAQAKSVDDLEELMAEDPFIIEGAATFEVVEFRTSLHAKAFAELADPRTRTVE